VVSSPSGSEVNLQEMLLNEGLSFLMNEEDISLQSKNNENPVVGSDSSSGFNVPFEGSGTGSVPNVPFNFSKFVDMSKQNNGGGFTSFGPMIKTENGEENGFKGGYPMTFPESSFSFDDDYLIKEEKILRPKKRKRNGEVKVVDPDEMEGDSLTKHKDSLIFMDSISFDKFVQKLSKKKTFTSEEKELVKDLRRKIKNRESARKSRMNKKSKVEDLEIKVKKLHDSTTYLSEYVAVLKNENKQLKEEIVYLMNLIQRNPIFSTLFQEYLLNPQNEFFSTLNSHQSLFLMALLYSFGLLTNVESFPDTISQIKTIYNNEVTTCGKEYMKETESFPNYKNEEDSGSSIEAF